MSREDRMCSLLHVTSSKNNPCLGQELNDLVVKTPGPFYYSPTRLQPRPEYLYNTFSLATRANIHESPGPTRTHAVMYGPSQDEAMLLEVIASMDVPFDSPELLALPAAGNNSPGWCASMNAHNPMVVRAPPDGGTLDIFHERPGPTHTHSVMQGSSQHTASSQDAASLFEVIASMDVPFHSPGLPALTAAVANSTGRRASMPVHQPMDTMHAGHEEQNCIDSWLDRTTHVPWVSVHGAIAHNLQQRPHTAPSWGGGESGHTSLPLTTTIPPT